ncbi:hypothetical protein HanPSC8_Chr14g0636051 [Helianthus annuus]|nr:hypothetical protein HanPSC8_Chr14g0636051 [Helianthus annuus]
MWRPTLLHMIIQSLMSASDSNLSNNLRGDYLLVIHILKLLWFTVYIKTFIKTFLVLVLLPM